tara:strand:- start:31798 stop:32088 length:291 start_codon:yes stop_codon:yes gene_type:complete
MSFGEYVRNLRESRNLYLRQVAAKLDMDTAMMSKIEHGERRIKKEHLNKLAAILNTDSDSLKAQWYADQVVDLLNGETNITHIFKIVKKEIIKQPK